MFIVIFAIKCSLTNTNQKKIKIYVTNIVIISTVLVGSRSSNPLDLCPFQVFCECQINSDCYRRTQVLW